MLQEVALNSGLPLKFRWLYRSEWMALCNGLSGSEATEYSGGSYHTISGQIKKIDDYQKQVILMDKTRIDIDCILDIDGQIYELVNESEKEFD